MADISQIQISNTVYDIKDNPARTEISEMPHSTSGTIAGLTILDNQLIEDTDYGLFVYESALVNADSLATLFFYNSDDTEETVINASGIKTYTLDVTTDITTPNIEIGSYLYLGDGSTATFDGQVFFNNAFEAAGGEVTDTFIVDGATRLKSTLNVTGDTTLNGNVDISEDAMLNVYGSAHIGGTLSVSGDTSLSGNIYLANNKALYGTNSSGTNYILAEMDSSNQALFGTTSNVTYLRGSTVYLQGATSLNSTLTVAGTATFSNTTDASGTADKSPAVIVGSRTGAHLEMDGNELMAKTSSTATGSLYLNSDGGSVYVNTSFRIPQIQYGRATVSTSAGSIVNMSITFSNAFGGTPVVFTNANTAGPDSRLTSAASPSSTGFTLYTYCSSSISLTVVWVAIY